MKTNRQHSAGSVWSWWTGSTSEAAPTPSSSGCWTTTRSWQGCCSESCCLRYQHTRAHSHMHGNTPKFSHFFCQLYCGKITFPRLLHWLKALGLKPQFKPLVNWRLNLFSTSVLFCKQKFCTPSAGFLV